VEYAGNDDAMKAGELESLVAKGLVARAAFGVQKAEQFLKRFGVGRISEEGSFTPDLHQVLVFQPCGLCSSRLPSASLGISL
jgi:hypothetical protein